MASRLPDRKALLEYIERNPDRSGKREIAKAFGLKGSDRIALKHLLRELTDDGALNRRGKRHVQPGALPPVSVFDVVSRNGDGELLARPVQWDADIEPPLAIVRHGRKGTPVGVGERILARTSFEDGTWHLRVMKRLEKSRRRTLGIFRTDVRDGLAGRIEPIDRRDRERRVREGDAEGAADGDLVEISVERGGRFAVESARVVEVIGSPRSEKAVSLIAIHAHDIPHIFPDKVIAEALSLEAAPMKGREDWRDVPLVTIDPATAKDHDDAVFAKADPEVEGGHIVTVAIADVSWYVRPGTAMDREAWKRGNSVYFPDRVVPMLPEAISNDLCSLKAGVDRAALAVRMRFDAKGRKTGHTFHRIMMRSPAALAYEETQAAVDGEPNERTQPLLDDVLKPLWAAYACLKRGRDERSPLEINAPERRIVLDEQGEVDRVEVPPRLDAHRLIEEFMIQANVAAAETLERRKTPLIYRVHAPPSLAKLESLRQFLDTLDIELAKSGQLRPSHFNRILEHVRETEFELLVNQVVLRSQSQAEYSPENEGHFGLNLARYAHFTSPIRRYADLVVHRALVAALDLGEGGLARDEEARLQETAEAISQTERRAMAAERDTVDRLIALHLADKVGATFAAHVNGVTKAGLFVTLDDTGADGFVPMSRLADEYMAFDEERRAVIGTETGRGYRMGDPVEVRLSEALPFAGALTFDMISEARPLDAGRSRHGAATRARKSGNRASARPFKRRGANKKRRSA